MTLSLVVAEPRPDAAQARLARCCQGAGVPLLQPQHGVNDSATLAAIADRRADFVLSVDNFQLFGAALLGMPIAGCINFHNAPIERYRGAHSPSWAIFNDEKTHGITWHYMERTVDAGPVVAEEHFTLTGTETALSLTVECVERGIRLFERDLAQILSGRPARMPATANARLYRRTDLPHDGLLDPNMTAAQIDRLLRATDFRPFPNPFTYARLRCARGDLIVNEVTPLAPNNGHEPGTIVATAPELVLACRDRLLSLSAVMLEPNETSSAAEAVARLELRAGQRLGRDSGSKVLCDRPCR